jgi:subtilase family serine protease
MLQEQQDNSSASYHRWLTPQQFGAQFGPAQQDIQSITTWLESHGFQVAGAAKGGMVIESSGTAGQVQQAFHTAIHKYTVNGEQRYANATNPMVPAGLLPILAAKPIRTAGRPWDPGAWRGARGCNRRRAQ